MHTPDMQYSTKASLEESWREVEESWSKVAEAWIEVKNFLPILFAIPCALAAQLSLVMTILVIFNWGRLEQRILLDEGDCSIREVIYKLGLWIASIWFTGLYGGVVFRLRYPFRLALILASTPSFLYFTIMGISNWHEICDMFVSLTSKIPPERGAYFLFAWLWSCLISTTASGAYLLEKAHAEYSEIHPEKSVDSEEYRGSSDPEKNIGAP